MEEKITYTEAYKELQIIVTEMENSQVTVDELDVKIKRAAQLLKICKDKLYTTEKNVEEILKEIKEYSAE